MLKDITIGQYYPADSVLHKLDPRVKLFATVIYVIALFSFKGIAGLALISAFLYAMIKISKVPFKFMAKGLKAIVILILITFRRFANALHLAASGTFFIEPKEIIKKQLPLYKL